MKKIKKLSVNRETIRSLSVGTLVGAVGGLSGHECTAGWTGCAACGGGGTLGNSACDACLSDVDCITTQKV
jgi:hypothetical protein